MQYKVIENGGVTSAAGYRAAGVACGIKDGKKKDLALVVSERTAAAAGIFTRNVVKGHSLQLTMEQLGKNRSADAVVVNSGCANACVGEAGEEAARQVVRHAAEILGTDPSRILINSTGVIGRVLDWKAAVRGLDLAKAQLSSEGGTCAEEAIMTTDTVKKEYAVCFQLEGKTVTIGGMAKGSGMIHPNMGTMISVITTDADVSAEILQEALRKVADSTYNRVSVDGDTSVCDMTVLLANGMAGNQKIDCRESSACQLFTGMLHVVCEQLARMLAKDGEGATKLLEVQVVNCLDKDRAYQIACAIAKSPLVKTAVFGQDANWGRIITAAGYAGVEFDPNKVDVWIGDILTCKAGCAVDFDEEAALAVLRRSEVTVTVDFHDGSACERMWTCDFSYDYVKINGSYRT